MKIIFTNILFLFLLFNSCSEEGKDGKAAPLSGSYSEICIQVNSQEADTLLQPYEMEPNDSLILYYSKLLQSDSIIGKTLLKLGENNTKEDIHRMRERLTFEGVEKTQVLKIHFYHPEEKLANTFLKNLMESLTEYIHESFIAEFNEKLEKSNKVLDSQSIEIYEYEQKLIEVLEKEEINTKYYVNYFEQDKEILQRKKALVSIKTCLASQDELCLSTTVMLVDESDLYLKAALENMCKLQIEKNQIQCSTTDNKECQEIDLKKNLLKKDILFYIDNSIEALSHESAEIQAKIKKIPKKNPNYGKEPSGNILNLNEEENTFLLEMKTTLMIERAGFINPIRIIEGPVYKKK